MPGPKDPRAYPDQFFALPDAVEPGKPITIEFATKTEAQRFRSLFYYFRGALKRDPGFSALYSRTMGLMVNVVGNTAVVAHRDDHDLFRAMRKALGDTVLPEAAPEVTPELAPVVDNPFEIANDSDSVVIFEHYRKRS